MEVVSFFHKNTIIKYNPFFVPFVLQVLFSPHAMTKMQDEATVMSIQTSIDETTGDVLIRIPHSKPSAMKLYQI